MAVMEQNHAQNAERAAKGDLNPKLSAARLPAEEPSAAKRFAVKSKKFICAGYSWFCGYDNSPTSEATLREFESHLHQITTLEQSKCEWTTLLVNSLVVVSVVIFIYVFFSVYTPQLAEHYKPDWLKEMQH